MLFVVVKLSRYDDHRFDRLSVIVELIALIKLLVVLRAFVNVTFKAFIDAVMEELRALIDVFIEAFRAFKFTVKFCRLVLITLMSGISLWIVILNVC